MRWLRRLRSIYPPAPLGFSPNEAFVSAQPLPRRAHSLVKGEPSEEPLSALTSRGDVYSPAPASVSHNQRVYVTEAQRIHDLDHSSRFKSETPGKMSDEGTPGRNGESDFFRALDSDVNSRDVSVRRPLRPW